MALFSYLLALTAFVSLTCFAEIVSLKTSVDLSANHHDRHHYSAGGHDDLDLLDIVLVASVDGKLHALNRTSGNTLWSMASASGTVPSTLAPLVRTQHPDIDPDITDDDSVLKETYVIEPQSGDIYVMSSPDGPLQRLPFSMPQLVDMSPFFSGDDEKRVFVGRKETSLLLIELETGLVKATVDSACPWDPFEDLAEKTAAKLDLDELDGTKAPKPISKSTEIFIGRTDYHVAIHTRLSSSAANPPAQNLVFSTYGPSNQDIALQSVYRRTADDTYIQSLPNGKVISFRTANPDPESDLIPSAHALWGNSFPNPIVAVFDILKAPNRQHPFVLLQPRPRLEELFPIADLTAAARLNRLPNLDSAYVGMVEETGSLFAMSPDRYPLVVFGDTDIDRRTIDPPRGPDFDPDRDLPPDVDSVVRLAKAKKLRDLCKNGNTDRRCLTGVRRLEESGNSRSSRLLDGAPTIPLPYNGDSPWGGPRNGDYPSTAMPQDLPGTGNNTVPPWPVGASADLSARGGTFMGVGSSTPVFSVLFLLAVAVISAVGWIFKKKRTGVTSLSPAENGYVVVKDVPHVHAVQDLNASDTILVRIDEELVEQKAEPARPRTPKRVDFALPSVVDEDSTSKQEQFESIEDNPDVDDSEKESGVPSTPGKKKGPRRKRGKKKKAGAVNGATDDPDTEKESEKLGEVEDHPNNNHAIPSLSPQSPPIPVSSSLVVSDTILGFGSHGTVVFKGSLQGRAVAVKRLLQDFVTLAAREVNLLQESDDHPNVIRYYYQESQANFLYIALELCPATLADVVERPNQFQDISIAFDPKRALRQITSGLRHLHALKIVHRDIKPQNILISHAKKGVGESAGHRMLISDFGLCRKLELDQTSFLPTAHGAMAAGTVGWRAPEILRGEVKLDDAGDESQSSRGSVGTPTASTGMGKPTRLTKSVDIFALGCLFYYVLTNGGHPFGERFERETNILKNNKCLDGLERFGEEGSEAVDLINHMLNPEAYDRPDTARCLIHPYFWDSGKRLNFLQDASDRFEIMCRDPRDANLVVLETGAVNVVGNDWQARLDKLFIENLGKFRKYDGRSVQDLLRALRNKKHHYQDMPDNLKRLLGSMPEGFLSYFTRRFPRLFLHVHFVISATSLCQESMFRTYFELGD